MSESNMIEVEVAYALPHRQKIYALLVDKGTTALEAARRTTVTRDFAGVDLDNAKMGIFGQLVRDPSKHRLQAGDRVEIYRPLVVDPKEIRRRRAARAAEKKAAATQGINPATI